MLYKVSVAIIIYLLFVLQNSFFSVLPGPFSNLNIVIVALVLGLLSARYETVLIAALTVGLLLDIESWYFFGLNLTALAATVVITYFCLINFLTNKSLYSFILLSLIATCVYEFSRLALIYAAGFILREEMYQSIISNTYFKGMAIEFALNAFLVIVAFYIMIRFTNILYSVVLKRGAVNL